MAADYPDRRSDGHHRFYNWRILCYRRRHHPCRLDGIDPPERAAADLSLTPDAVFGVGWAGLGDGGGADGAIELVGWLEGRSEL